MTILIKYSLNIHLNVINVHQCKEQESYLYDLYDLFDCVTSSESCKMFKNNLQIL